MALVTNTSTFNKTDLPGWYSRLIYSYVDLDQTYISCNGNFFEDINLGYARGSYIFPAGYWEKAQGRVLRIQGCFLYSGTDAELNIQARIIDSNNDSVNAFQNLNTTHIFYNQNTYQDLPVFLNLELSYCNDSTFNWSGYYEYDAKSAGAGGGENLNVAYVPVYRESSGVGLLDAVTLDTNLSLRIGPNSIQPVYLTIEELG